MLLTKQLLHHQYTHFDPLVLKVNILKFPITVDRDQTVSQRFEPNSRTVLIGEQPNPLNPFQLKDTMSRHRGAKRFR